MQPVQSNLFLRFRHMRLAGEHARQRADLLVWDVFVAGKRAGRIALDFAAAEFAQPMARYAPALRLYIRPVFRDAGCGAAACECLRDFLQRQRFGRPIQACHVDGDADTEHLLMACGFLHTGCRSVGRDGRAMRHMIALP